ncbi:family 18 glycosyl hydrolase [Chaetomium sp. MPI-CAGE-AT-0009]|nr:family 18 glycosyl hydrolase [Chaetomium sp. MPI-CAGE-AT-0009]
MIFRSLITAALAAAAFTEAAQPATRYAMYYDQYHTSGLPNKTLTAGITHVLAAFANSSLFASSPAGEYTPFQPLSEIRAMFDNSTKLCMVIGGWGDTNGFGLGSKNDTTRRRFARNVADTLARLGYDCVDIDWEYPGGNGADYKQNVNSNKKGEIAAFPKLLAEIKKAIGDKELAIAVPGLERDMLAFTRETCPKINAVVDFVTVMTYDLMNRRDTATKHHTPILGSLQAIDKYISLGFDARKLHLGFALYAKWFTTAPGVDCSKGIGCATELLENADGTDTGKSGAMTFEAANFKGVPTNLTLSPDASCGANTFFKCSEGNCCGQYGFCGNTPAHCGTGCQAGFGRCEGSSTTSSFQKAVANGKTDKVNGGQWYWDSEGPFFWTFDTPELVRRKFDEIVKARGLGGVSAWSLGEDSHNYSLIKAIQTGVQSLTGCKEGCGRPLRWQSKHAGRHLGRSGHM